MITERDQGLLEALCLKVRMFSLDQVAGAIADDGVLVMRGGFDDASELVPGNAGEPGITFEDLKIGAADAGVPDADEALGGARRNRHVRERERTRARNEESFHDDDGGTFQSRAGDCGGRFSRK